MKLVALSLLAAALFGQAVKPVTLKWQPTNALAKGLMRDFVVNGDATVLVDYAGGRNLKCTGMSLAGIELTSDGTGTCTGTDAGMPAGNSPWSFSGYFDSTVTLGNGTDQALFTWGTSVAGELAAIAQYTAPLYCGTKDTFAATMLASMSCGTTTVNDGARHLGAVTYDGVSVSIYVDGALQTVNGGASPLNITLSGAIHAFAGWAGGGDGFLVWNRALNAAEVLSDFADHWQTVRSPASVSCTIGGVPQQCLIQGISATLNAQGQMVLFEPIGPVGPQGAPGQPASGALNMTCPLTPCIGISANNAQVQNVVAPDPVTGAYTLGAASAVGLVVHVGDTSTGLEIFPGAYSMNGNVLTLAAPLGHTLYCVWWMQ